MDALAPSNMKCWFAWVPFGPTFILFRLPRPVVYDIDGYILAKVCVPSACSSQVYE